MERESYISDAAVVKRAKAAVKIELEKNEAMDIPITVYDRETQTIYRINSNGSRAAVAKK